MDEIPSTPEAPSSSGSSNSNMLKIIVVIILVIVVALVVWMFILSPKSTQQMVVEQPSPTTSAQTQPTEAMMEAGYKDGTYSASGTYQNPASVEQVDITITIKDGVVTAATFAGTPDTATTVTMQNKFKTGFEKEVVGKKIDGIALTVVNGSSLTPKGFTDALEKIKTQAKSS